MALIKRPFCLTVKTYIRISVCGIDDRKVLVKQMKHSADTFVLYSIVVTSAGENVELQGSAHLQTSFHSLVSQQQMISISHSFTEMFSSLTVLICY